MYSGGYASLGVTVTKSNFYFTTLCKASASPRLVDFAVERVEFIYLLPDGQLTFCSMNRCLKLSFSTMFVINYCISSEAFATFEW